MPLTISGKPYGLGALIVPLVLIISIVLFIVGQANSYELLLLAALALGVLIG